MEEIKDNIICINNKIVKQTNENCYHYTLSSIKDVINIWKYMYYPDHGFCLQRKKSKLIEFLQMKNEHQKLTTEESKILKLNEK